MARIGILGSGAVGTAVGSGFMKLGNQVMFYDLDGQRVREICNLGLNATTDLARVIYQSDISFLCVPTPTRNRRIDLTSIESVTEDVAHYLKDKSDYHVVVVKSTVAPMTTERSIIPLLEKSSDRKVGSGIGVCVNPEFLTEAHRSWTEDNSYARDFFTVERIVIGEFDKRSGDAVEVLYRSLNIPIIRTDLRTAEMIKYACNGALATRVSYWNEIYYICRRIGVDSDFVAHVATMDERVGQYGRVHGKAFGGKCLPKDLEAFISFAEELGYEPRLLKAVRDINERIKADKGVRE